MKIVRIAVVAVFAAVTALWVLTGITAERRTDKVPPVITAASDRLVLSVQDDKSKLFEGLTATDNRDGDLTDKILVGEHSKFSEPGVMEVTYLVFDTDNNVGRYTRTVEYQDYKPLRFSLQAPLVFGVGEKLSILSALHLTDSIDGDISSKIRIMKNTTDASAVGTYSVYVEGTNAYGDKVGTDLFVHIVNKNLSSPQISLSTYLVYLNKDEAFQPRSYIHEIILSDGIRIKDSGAVRVESTVDTSRPGSYDVEYSYQDARGQIGYTAMTVIVTGEEA